MVAVKCVLKSSLNRASTENLLTEIELLKKLKHEHIVCLKDFQVWNDTIISESINTFCISIQVFILTLDLMVQPFTRGGDLLYTIVYSLISLNTKLVLFIYKGYICHVVLKLDLCHMLFMPMTRLYDCLSVCLRSC